MNKYKLKIPCTSLKYINKIVGNNFLRKSVVDYSFFNMINSEECEPGSDFLHFFVFKICNARNTGELSRLFIVASRPNKRRRLCNTVTAVKNREIRCQLQTA